jgi:hypothetical protein
MRPDLEALAGILDNGGVFDGDLAYAAVGALTRSPGMRSCQRSCGPDVGSRRGDGAYNARREGPYRPVAHHVVWTSSPRSLPSPAKRRRSRRSTSSAATRVRPSPR